MDAFGQAGARLQQIAPKAATTMQNIAGDARTPASLKVRAVALALGYAQAASDEISRCTLPSQTRPGRQLWGENA